MRKKYSTKGFSIIELLLAGALFAAFAWGVVSVLLFGLATDRLGEETTIATQYATEGMEAARSMAAKSFDALNTTEKTGLSQNSGDWAFSGEDNTFTKYTRVIAVKEVKRGGDGNIDGNGGDNDPDTRQVMVTVSWQVTPGQSDSVVLDTYLTRFK